VGCPSRCFKLRLGHLVAGNVAFYADGQENAVNIAPPEPKIVLKTKYNVAACLVIWYKHRLATDLPLSN